MILQIISMDSSAESFEIVNWKLDLVKSHFSAEKKSNSQPALDQEGSNPNTTSLIQESRRYDPHTPPTPIIKKKLDVTSEEIKLEEISLLDTSKPCSDSWAQTPKCSGINLSANHWRELGDTIRPLKTESSVNSLIITPDDETDKDVSVSETPVKKDQKQARSINHAKSFRPKLIRNKCQFPVSLESLGGKNDHDQGRNCVVVIFKSKTTDSPMERERTVLNNRKEVDKLLKKYKLKYDFSYSSQFRAVYNLCFHSPTETRKLVRDLSDISAKISGPKALHNFLCHEEMLGMISFHLSASVNVLFIPGYQHIPVLTEQEMLTLHSPEYVDNVLSTTHDVKVVTGDNDEITFVFKTVIELNVFIFDKCSKETAKTLGELKANAKPLKLVSDEDGFYRVTSKSPRSQLEPFTEKYRFELKDVRLAVRTLCFRRKADLFEFLLDENNGSIKNLRIDASMIVECEESSVLKCVDPSGDLDGPTEENYCTSASTPRQVGHTTVDELVGGQICLDILDMVDDDDDSVLNDSCATEASVYEAVIAQKDDEIRLLKSQLSQKDDVIRRKENENRKIETKLFDSQEVLTQVTKIITNNNSLQHVIPEVRENLKNNKL